MHDLAHTDVRRCGWGACSPTYDACVHWAVLLHVLLHALLTLHGRTAQVRVEGLRIYFYGGCYLMGEINRGARREPFNAAAMGVNSTSFAPPHVRPMGVHRTCGEPDKIVRVASLTESRETPTRKMLPLFCFEGRADAGPAAHDRGLRAHGRVRVRRAVQEQLGRLAGPHTRHEPLNDTPMGVNSTSFGSPRVRCTPMGRTCGA